MRAIDAEGCETNYFGIINKILEFSFARNKELKVVFFDCDWFDSNNGTRQNQLGMVEVKHNDQLWGYDTFILAHQVEQVYYLTYPYQKLSAWWVVHKVNPVNGYILWTMLGIMILQHWMMTLMSFIKKRSCHPLLLSILVPVVVK
jgi:hypothetical protein